ncbi:GAF domain-containing sensor histidine kinase [Deinococcus pimensis]|uniref:GAF domain-containing sensor histidine kinase n=1 Tax=Deinococcus pimensis TaxID=309888 RepID=UPI00146FC7CB|nr:GAF domain-containing sensor histidine kinase [Deinococcus pimensis]
MSSSAEQRVEALVRIASSVAFGHSLQETLDSIARSVVEQTEVLACGVTVSDPTDRTPWLWSASYGFPDGYVDAAVQCWQRGALLLTTEVYRTLEPIVMEDARQFILDRSEYAPMHEMERGAPWNVIACLPLVTRGKPVGTIYAYYADLPDETGVRFLKAIADQAAVAVDNAQLLEEARGKAALEERQRLARELHDSVSQALYGIAMSARAAQIAVKRDPHGVSVPVEYILSLAEGAITEMRALIFELRPETLLEEGLVVLLTKRAAATRTRHEVEVEVEFAEEPDVPLAVKEALYRVAQEALHNVVKHAQASRVFMRLVKEDDQLVLEVCDDGVGFDATAAYPGHLGQQSMRERVSAVGGTLSVTSAPGQGTAVRITVPTSP